ncbi:MAG: hypothetical protein WEC59_12335 [Salibacteraceae bacterium]
MEFSLESPNLSQVAEIYIQFEGLSLGAKGFEESFQSIKELEEPIDLSSALLKYDKTNNNELEIDFQVFDENGIDISNGFKLILQFRNVLFKRLRGWFDQFSLGLSRDTISIDLFDRWKSGSVYLEDPRAILSIQNSFGVPFFASISTFDALENGAGSMVIPITFDNELGDSFAIQYPNSTDIEGFVNSVYVVDDGNSNIANVIRLSPNMLEYKLNLTVNHDVDLQEAGEISDSSRVFVSTKVELPLTGRLDKVVARDTFSVAVGLPKEIKPIKRLAIGLTTDNGLPIDAVLQCYFLDHENNAFDSLFTDGQFMRSAEIDELGKPVRSTLNATTIDLDNDQILKLDQLHAIAIKTKLETTENGQETITIYGDNHLGIQLKMLISYQVL